MTKRILLLMICCVVPAVAQSNQAPASKDEVVRFINLMQNGQDLQSQLKPLMEQVKKSEWEMFQDQLKADGKELSPQKMQAAKEYLDASIDEAIKQFPEQELRDRLVAIYQKHFTSDDITALVTFYTSPAGRKFLGEMPVLMQEAMGASMDVMRSRMPSIMKAIEEKRDKFLKQLRDDN
jgi:uncharacterized protein